MRKLTKISGFLNLPGIIQKVAACFFCKVATFWNNPQFVGFIAGLNKEIKSSTGLPLTKKDEFAWIDLFEESKAQVKTLKLQIDEKEKELDMMVFKLYHLNDVEIEIVYNS
ncbi:MAG: hypothetical protein EOO88_60520 [Pedobacter sp.]|nr:MAG: hypothetical protein EOO88_60520 [Pedobacter sp.]